MATVTIKINTGNNKTRRLVDFITELSKTEKGITVIEEKPDFIKSIDQSFKELELVKMGKLKPNPARNIINEL
jgi:hypothetical protein